MLDGAKQRYWYWLYLQLSALDERATPAEKSWARAMALIAEQFVPLTDPEEEGGMINVIEKE